MLGYNQARKIAYIPFPFPHAQIASLFVLVAGGFLPVLFLSYLENEYFGFIMNLLTVMAFAGLHEVARELENPFLNVPNDLPLNNFHAQFNEGLMTMFSGYHPDAYWEIQESEYPPTPPPEPEEVTPPSPAETTEPPQEPAEALKAE
jgi:predicted membrane chloride channel (bestrophin family)